MIYLKLFLTFLKIGAVSFGGGYGMLALMRENVVGNGWLTDSQVMDFIAVSESTPGPIAVNMATFVGSSQGGLLGALLATLGVILPAYLIIWFIAALLKNFLKYKVVEGFLSGVRPAVVALIIGTALTMGMGTLFNYEKISSDFCVNYIGIIVLVIVVAIAVTYKKLRHKKMSPIILILISAALGILLSVILPGA